jgi:hypothetical protein
LARNLVILEPTSFLGQELMPLLAAQFPQLRRQYFHTAEEEDHLILELAGENVVVAPLRDPQELEDAAAVVIADSPGYPLHSELMTFFQEHPQLICLDLSRSGVLFGPPAFLPYPGQRHLLFPDPILLLPSVLLQALAPLKPHSALFTSIAPVSIWGEVGMEELAEQAVARLQGKKPPRGFLSRILAFEVLPYGLTSATLAARLEDQLQSLFPSTEVVLHPLMASVFHGHALFASVGFWEATTPKNLRQLLAEAGFVWTPGRPAPAPSQASGEGQLLCNLGRCRRQDVTLWVVGDHFRLLAQAACRALQELLSTALLA